MLQGNEVAAAEQCKASEQNTEQGEKQNLHQHGLLAQPRTTSRINHSSDSKKKHQLPDNN